MKKNISVQPAGDIEKDFIFTMGHMQAEQEFIDILADAARAIGLPLTDGQCALFRLFRNELLLWNSKMNLLSIQDSLDLPIKHCIDSLLPARFISKPTGSLLDIGSGGGFPGIPLKIVLPDLAVTMLDASRKKTSFLKGVAAKLRLEAVRVVQARVEAMATDPAFTGRFDVVTSRAAFKLADLLTLGYPFLKKDGVLIAMKGKGLAEEWPEAMRVAGALGVTVSEQHDLCLPVLGDLRKIILFSTS